jgi:integrase
VRLVWYGVKGMGDYGCIVRLLLLTGCRRAEIGKLAWSEVNFAERQLELPRVRTKNGRAHVVPLSPLALSCFPPKRDGYPHVFGRVVGIGFAGWSRCKLLLDSNLTGMAPWRVHDLRRTMVTMMTERQIAPPWIVEQCVNHLGAFKGGVAGTYNRAQNLPERRDALERWSAEVARIVGAC